MDWPAQAFRYLLAGVAIAGHIHTAKPETAQAFRYLLAGVAGAAGQFLSFFGPLVLLGFLVHLSALCVRAGAPGVFRAGFYRLLTAPGIILHEAAHLFFCHVSGHRVRQVRLFSLAPGEAPGSVAHSFDRRSIRQRAGNFFIGTGPLWVGAGVIFFLSRFMLHPAGLDFLQGAAGLLPPGRFFPGPGELFSDAHPLGMSISAHHHHPWLRALSFYLAFSIGGHMALSPSDFRAAADGLLVIFLLVLILNWAGILPGILTPGFQSAFAAFNFQVVFLVAFAVALNLLLAAVFALAGLLLKTVGRR